jgi:hypothetical protein
MYVYKLLPLPMFMPFSASFLPTRDSRLQRALRMYDRWAIAEPRPVDIVLFTRPDMIFKERGYELTLDIVGAFGPLRPIYDVFFVIDPFHLFLPTLRFLSPMA